ncbi:MAG: SRPBCC domain-containing protein [Pirellulaceae bacterium]
MLFLGISLIVAFLGGVIWFANAAKGFTFEHEVKTDLSMDQVYRVLTDRDLQQFWGNARTNYVVETPGDFKVGTRVTYSVVDGDKVYAFTEEIVELAKPNRLVVKIETEPFEATLTYTILRLDSQTELHVVADGNLKGWAKWGGSVALKAIEDKIKGDLEELGLKLNRSIELRMILDNSN